MNKIILIRTIARREWMAKMLQNVLRAGGMGDSCFSTRRRGVASTLTSAADRSVRMPAPPSGEVRVPLYGRHRLFSELARDTHTQGDRGHGQAHTHGWAHTGQAKFRVRSSPRDRVCGTAAATVPLST